MKNKNQKLQELLADIVVYAHDAEGGLNTYTAMSAEDWQKLLGNLDVVYYLAMDARQAVRRRIKSAQQSVQADGATTFRTTVTVTKSDAPPLEFEDEESPRR